MTAISILYLDDHLVVVNKPSGLLVHRGMARDREVAMTLVRDAIGARVDPVHRLDRATSGALLFSRNSETSAALGALFESGRVEKTYRALVRGVPQPEGVVDHPVPQREGGPRVEAVTAYRLLGASTIERCALVEATPRTGRFHQIRRHMKHLGHPLIGDVNYGRGELNRDYRARYALHRLALHACALAFEHPTTRAMLRVVAPMPADLSEPLERLGLGAHVALS